MSLPVIVWNSKGYKEIANYMDRFQIARVGVDFEAPDFPALASGFGCFGCRPESAEKFREAVTEALSAPKPTLIEIVEDVAWLQ